MSGDNVERLHIPGGQLASIVLPQDSNVKRDMPRPVELRQPEYEQQFDFHTLFYDCFSNHYGDLVMLGPPLLNFRSHFGEQCFKITSPQGTVEASSIEAAAQRTGWCQDEIVLTTEKREINQLQVALGELGQYDLNPSPYLGSLFQGTRTLFAMVKYDPISWIKEWATFYAKYHGSNALLIYNNDSPLFSGEELLDALSPLQDLTTIIVIDWPFRYGPQAAGIGRWDSVFCKTGAFQHAYKRFLWEAASVINVDVDELLVHEHHVSIHEMVEASQEKYVTFPGIWASRPQDTKQETLPNERTHRLYQYHGNITPSTQQCPDKWAVVPEACPQDSQWRTHDIAGLSDAAPCSGELRYRHFRDLNSGWKLQRTKPLQAYHKDRILIEAYKKIGWLP